MHDIGFHNRKYLLRSNSLMFGRMMRDLPKPVQDRKIYDVVIIGGGINAAGEARDLALRGASVLVLHDSNPYKATNASTRLGHGGLRYLPNFEFRLVREARQELEHLLYMAPHLTRKLGMLVPIWKGDPFPNWRLPIGIGLKFYDFFVKSGVLPKHRYYTAQQLMGNPGNNEGGFLPTPLANPDKLVGGYFYYDTQIAYPERLSIENFRDALSQNTPDQPVHVLGHTRVTGTVEKPRQKGEAAHVNVTFQDQLNPKKGPITVKARYVINTTGASVDKLNAAMKKEGIPQNIQPNRMGPTKGTHIIVKNTIGLQYSIYAPSKEKAEDGKTFRPFFINPFPFNKEGQISEYLLIGTTDDKHKTHSPFPEPGEIDYLIRSANGTLPALKLSEKDVVTAYSGFRPLPASDKASGKVPRQHFILWDSRVAHIIGGKITTYRNLAQQVSDQVTQALLKDKASELSRNLKNNGQSITAQRKLPGGEGIRDIERYKRQWVEREALRYNLSTTTIRELINRYGSLYSEVLRLTQSEPNGWELRRTLTPYAPLIKAQVLHAIRYENAETLMDIMTESLKLDLLPEGGGDYAIQEAATILAAEKQLTPTEKVQEIQAYRNHLFNLNEKWRSEDLKKQPKPLFAGAYAASASQTAPVS